MLLEQEWSRDCDAGTHNESYWLNQYLPLVKRVLGQLRNQVNTVIDADDLSQIGIMGLLEAIRRYGGPPDEGFAGFAFKRVRGAILDELRRHDWRPRQLRQQSHQCAQTERELMRSLGRRPTETELADAMGVEMDELRNILYAGQMAEMDSLQQLLEHGHEPAQDEALDRLEQQRHIRALLGRLPEREQRLMSLYYQHDLNMKEIALVLDLTESRVCQLHKQCLALLNREFAQGGEK
ncbi:FliA/WhiG family RNA polymerase sigma factor [Oceanimonas sp. CHS3-5]|uniref:FliA/WhiG family RNA polymerase sigma factor n=1 Tax=Oceanimonas sp. CHS3-5 TaxID=3068186 RepID=UPI00273EF677|nr:FliA/WhiG family RNA polymerase sigma factor [Oceanimonas sp. CHS3-5]MDP5292372.1 FliA/WhiG family RNA polymerase sigma factor [Oceanimonas sp. CHS3-5]